MTLEELDSVFKLKNRLQNALELEQTLRDAAYPGGQRLDGMPHGTGVKDKVGDLAVELADLATSIEALEREIKRKERRIEKWIKTIEDETVRMIFRLRFLRGLPWKEVARYVGRYATESSVKSAAYRYLQSGK